MCCNVSVAKGHLDHARTLPVPPGAIPALLPAVHTPAYCPLTNSALVHCPIVHCSLMPSDSLYSHPHCALVHCRIVHCPLSHSLPSHPHCPSDSLPSLSFTTLALTDPRVHCPLSHSLPSRSLTLAFTALSLIHYPRVHQAVECLMLICQAICEQYLDALQTHDFDVFQPALQQPNYFSLQVTRHAVVGL